MESEKNETLVSKVKKKMDSIFRFINTKDFGIAFIAALLFSFYSLELITISLISIPYVLKSERKQYYKKEFKAFIVIRLIMDFLLILIFGFPVSLTSPMFFYPLLFILLLLVALFVPIPEFRDANWDIKGGMLCRKKEGIVTNTETAGAGKVRTISGWDLVKICLRSKKFFSMFVLVLLFMSIVIFGSLETMEECSDEMCGIIVLFAAVGGMVVSFPTIMVRYGGCNKRC